MRSLILLIAFLQVSVGLFSQEIVTLQFSRVKKVAGSIVNIKIEINDTEVGTLANGDSISLDVKLPETRVLHVKVTSGLHKREVAFVPDSAFARLTTGYSGAGITLNLLSGGELLKGEGGYAALKVGKKDGSLSYTSVSVLSSDTIRNNWIGKGGKIVGKSYQLFLSLTTYSTPELVMRGGGGSHSYTITHLNFKVPEYAPGIQKWHSFVYGTTFQAGIYGSSTTIEVPPLEPMTFDAMSANLMMSANMGYTLGVGKFKTPSKWKGAAFEITYRPSIIVTMYEGADPETSFNAGGVGFDVNFNSFYSNAAKLAPKAQSKITVFFLPPLGDKPLFFSAGYGLTWYKRK